MKKNTIINEEGKPFSTVGRRRAIINDLSPIATFISQNYLQPLDVDEFEREARRLLKETEDECGWMYQTNHKDGKTGRINFTVWSDIYSCPECAGEINFVKEAFDKDTKSIRETVKCPHCAAQLSKSQMDLAYETKLDPVQKANIKIPRRVPVIINYSVGGTKFEKEPDKNDLALIKRIEQEGIAPKVPTMKLPEMQMARVGRMQTVGITHLHHFFLPRPAIALATLWRKAKAHKNARVETLCFSLSSKLFGDWLF